MRSKTLGQLLADLSITKTHSRPHVSDDNPFSESQFKTLKYRPNFPERFGSLEDARAFCREFFDWYNTRHHHAGIGFLTPAQVHHGLADGAVAHRQHVLERVYREHPERFPHGPPRASLPPREVWINPPRTTAAHASSQVELATAITHELPATSRLQRRPYTDPPFGGIRIHGATPASAFGGAIVIHPRP
jgi:hypothetical protein